MHGNISIVVFELYIQKYAKSYIFSMHVVIDIVRGILEDHVKECLTISVHMYRYKIKSISYDNGGSCVNKNKNSQIILIRTKWITDILLKVVFTYVVFLFFFFPLLLLLVTE